MRLRLPFQLRWKILLAMLLIGITPLMISAWLDVRGISNLGAMLAQQSGQALSDQTRASLEQMADSYARLMEREGQLIELLVRIQAAHAEKLLGDSVPTSRDIYWADEFDGSEENLALETLPTKYVRPDAAGKRIPLPVSFVHQSFHSPLPADRALLEPHARRLAGMSTLYREAHRHHGDVVLRQYVALENGMIGTYPGHGGYPDDFDPRERPWYVEQRADRRFRWSRPHTDVTSHHALVNATMPIRDGDGNFAGVTGIDVRLTSMLRRLVLPAHLSADSEVLLTIYDQPSVGVPNEVLIIAKTTGTNEGGDWKEVPEVTSLVLDNEHDLSAMISDIRHDRAGYLRTHYAGRDVFCVYHPLGRDRPYLVFLIPASAVVNPAIRAAEYALASTKRQVDALIPVAIGIIFIVALFALISSKTITEPINRLADAATRVGDGDFDVRVAIDTGDELEHLGNAFNSMVPQLEEHTRVREALRLASEVQQHLLPADSPELGGIDLAGFSFYCDQTGGDYYDFLDLSSDDDKRIGIAIGDVSGHGIASALLMTTVRALLRSVADGRHSPAEILQHINDKLIDDISGGSFMTLFYLVVDLDRRQIEWASAGHDPAICYRSATDSFSLIEGVDIPLGVEQHWRYSDTPGKPLAAGDIVLLGTDGIWETRNAAGEFFGKQHLQDIMREQRHESAATICDHVVRALSDFRGNAPQRDDVTAVVFRLTV